MADLLGSWWYICLSHSSLWPPPQNRAGSAETHSGCLPGPGVLAPLLRRTEQRWAKAVGSHSGDHQPAGSQAAGGLSVTS